jgi:hypothetical protein
MTGKIGDIISKRNKIRLKTFIYVNDNKGIKEINA